MVNAAKAGECDKAELLEFSADGSHMAYTCIDYIKDTDSRSLMKDTAVERVKVVVDGKSGSYYSQVEDFQWSATGAHYGYIGTDDPNRVGVETTHEVVIDGTVRKDVKGAIRMFKDLTLSPDGTRFAYTADLDRPGRESRSVSVVDGKASPEYRGVSAVTFSRDGKHTVAVGSLNSAVTLFDGQEQENSPLPQGVFFFDLAGKAYAYPVLDGATWKVQIEGVGQPVRTGIEIKPGMSMLTDRRFFAGSPDGKSTIYTSPTPAGIEVVFNEKALSTYRASPWRNGAGNSDLPPFIYSPDGKYVAYTGVIQAGGNSSAQTSAVFLNDVGLPPNGTNSAQFGLPRFSADSRHFAFVNSVPPDPKSRDQRWQVVLDGQLGPIVDAAIMDDPASVTFLPDGRLQFVGATGKNLQRFTIDPGKTTIEDFFAVAKSRMAKSPVSGATGGPATSVTSASPSTPAPGNTVKDPVGTAKETIKKGLGGILKR
jgi:hypothetical protein